MFKKIIFIIFSKLVKLSVVETHTLNTAWITAGGKFNDLFNALTKTVGGEMLNGLTLYTVKPEDLKFGGTSYSPKDMVVTDSGLQLTLTPQK